MSDNVVKIPASPLTKVVGGETVRLIPEHKINFSDERTPRAPFDGKTCPNCGCDVSAANSPQEERASPEPVESGQIWDPEYGAPR